jgi:hypothetical protein
MLCPTSYERLKGPFEKYTQGISSNHKQKHIQQVYFVAQNLAER